MSIPLENESETAWQEKQVVYKLPSSSKEATDPTTAGLTTQWLGFNHYLGHCLSTGFTTLYNKFQTKRFRMVYGLWHWFCHLRIQHVT